MKRSSMLLIFLFLVSLPTSAVTVAAPEDEIRRLIDDYVVGWREGDSEILSRVFELDHGYVIWTTTDESGKATVDSMSFRDIVARGKAAGPSYGERVGVLRIDVTDETVASVKLQIAFSGGTYLDHLTLYKVGDHWKIVTKAFAVRPE